MTTKSMVDKFAAGIVVTTSAYLTACLGTLLTIAIMFRRFDPPDTARLTLPEEGLFLLATLALTYVAVWCAGYLAIFSTKNKMLRSNLPDYGHGTPREGDHRPREDDRKKDDRKADDRKAIAPVADPAEPVTDPSGPTAPENQHVTSIQSALAGAAATLYPRTPAAEIAQERFGLIAEVPHH